MIKALGGRKVIVGILVLAIGVAVEMLRPEGLSGNMVNFLLGMSIGYFLTNVGVHATEVIKEKDKAKRGRPPEIKVNLSEVIERVDALETNINNSKKDGEATIKALINQNAVITQATSQISQGMNALLQMAGAGRQE